MAEYGCSLYNSFKLSMFEMLENTLHIKAFYQFQSARQ